MLTPTASRSNRTRFATLLAGIALACAAALPAQTIAPLPPTVGSSNPVSAEPLVARPSTTPCIVPLFTNQAFDDYSDHDSTYTPPAGCKGPWSKVVFSANFNVSAGLQYDRTAKFFLGGANIFFGSTPEPRSSLSPSWHVERNITDLSALLKTSQPVVLSLYNVYGEDGGTDYNGSITGSAELEFYPANFRNPAPAVPDAVVPLNPAGATTALQTTTDRLTGTFNDLPRNIEGAYLQLFSQSQASDEFWYTCSPSSVAAQLDNNCGNTAFRETEVYVDGKAAGIAPVYPWIYTGGIDPYLWEPITGVQTLNFKPYLVDLTPFAGVLSNGQQHTVAIGVYNADAEFDVTGTLLIYLDHGSKQVTGEVTQNTLDQAPTPYVSAPTPTTVNGLTTGTTLVASVRGFQLSGYVNTSHGRVSTTIDETVDFGNYQTISFNNSVYNQNITQASGAASITRKQEGGIVTTVQKTRAYPFTFNYGSTSNADGSYGVTAQSDQQDIDSETHLLFGIPIYNASAQEQVKSSDQYQVSAANTLTSQTTSSTGSYNSHNSLGGCYSRTLTSNALKLSSVTDGQGCPGGNRP